MLPDHLKELQFLIVDDYASMTLLLKADLKKIGVQKILSANSGNSAYKIIKDNINTANEIQFVITDLLMPDGTGKEMTALIRNDATTKHLPILMISSMTDINLMLDCVKTGISDYIVKPWELTDLVNKIVTSSKQKK